jgi:hypothetical protein
MRFHSAMPIVFALRLIIGTCFCMGFKRLYETRPPVAGCLQSYHEEIAHSAWRRILQEC